MIPRRQKYPVQIIHSNCCDLAESSHGNEYFLRDSSADPAVLVDAGAIQPTNCERVKRWSVGRLEDGELSALAYLGST